MKVWITKYALTQGILEKDAQTTHTESMIAVKNEGGFPDREYFHKPNWHHERTAAVERANQMVQKKIASLQKSLSKMNKLHFD